MYRFALVAIALGACGRIGFDDHELAVDSAIVDADPLRPETVVQIAAGGRTSCVLRHDGGVWCWGMASDGRLGDGTVGIDRGSPAPTTLTSGAVELFANDAGFCALLEAGGLQCWGDNSGGALGFGDASPRTIPTVVPNVTGVDSIAIATNSACLLKAGVVECAGVHSQLGTGESIDRFEFEPVPGLTNVQQITGGNYFQCALLIDGSTRCWGNNAAGQLGDGSTVDRELPVPGPSGPYTQISAGDEFACGVTPTRTVECWGTNALSQLGNDGTPAGGLGPVLGLDDVIVLDAAATGACALRGDRSVWCWGDGTYGQLGNGSSTTRATPMPATLPTPTVQISARTDIHTCALDVDHIVRCWGNNSNGALGLGAIDNFDHATPTPVLGLP